MTDLERVRDALLFAERNLGRLGNGVQRPSEDRDLWKTPHEALDIIDAHLKEDAERETETKADHEYMAKQDDELARLREAEDARQEDLRLSIVLTAQRDTLLAALKKIEQFGKPNAYALTIPRDIARRAIAEVEGKP